MAEIEDGGLYLDRLIEGDRPSLAHYEVVWKLVREFSAAVLLVRTGFDLGSPAAKEPLAVIEEQARKCGDAIMGRSADFVAQEWNNEARLGAVIKVLLPNECRHYGDPGAALFMWLANQTLTAARAQNEGTPESEVQKRLAAICDDVTARILGIK